MAVDDLIKRKLKIISAADDDLVNKIQSTENSVLKAVLGKINKLKAVGGNFQSDDTALQLINELKKDIERIIKKSTYGKNVKQYLRSFDDITNINTRLHKELNKISLSKVPINTFKKEAINNVTAALTTFDNINTNVANPIRKLIFDSVATGANVESTKKAISTMIAGSPKRLGIMRRWVSQIARDAVGQYDGLVNDVIAKEYNLNAYRYVGSLIGDSRWQCRRWVNMGTILIKDLPDEIRKAAAQGSGHNPALNGHPEKFSQFRGGFNCRHHAVPIFVDEAEASKIVEKQKEKPKSDIDFIPNNKELAKKLTFDKKRPKGWAFYGLNFPDQIFDGLDIQFVRLGGGDHYQPATKQISIGKGERWRKSKYQRKKIVAHEVGHALHEQRDILTSFTISKEYDDLFKELKKIHRGKWAKIHDDMWAERRKVVKDRSLLKQFGADNIDDYLEMWGATYDTLGGLTKGRFGGGHSKAYYKRYNGDSAEVFAHIHTNFWVGNPVFKQFFPKIHDIGNEFIAKLYKI